MYGEQSAHCKNCGQRFFYRRPGAGRGRVREFCDNCVAGVKRDQAADRKRRQRAKQKENEVTGVANNPASVRYEKNSTSRSAGQVPAKKTSDLAEPITPLPFGRGVGGSAPDRPWDFDEITRRVDRIMSPLGFLYL